MNTAQELMAQIKGWEYMIAVLFLSLFIWFWRELGRERRRRRQLQPAPPLIRSLSERHQATKGYTLRTSLGPRAQPCWEARQCSPQTRERCPGYALSPLPCWVARSLVEGKRWEPCATCPVYTQEMERLLEVARRDRLTSASTAASAGGRR
mgnify:CR=1 FL=1